MPVVIDWTAIQSEYEQGISQRSLALKYSISQSAISQKAKKHGWLITPLIIPQNLISSDNATVKVSELSDVEIIERAKMQLAQFLDNEGLTEVKDHKLFADAMSQYIKLKMLMPQQEDGQDYTAYDIRKVLIRCTDDERAFVNAILRRLAQEDEEEKIKPIRRIG